MFTDFFPEHILPYRVGVYQVMPQFHSQQIYYAYWDGEKFGFRATNPIDAESRRNEYTHAGRYAIWRGIKL